MRRIKKLTEPALMDWDVRRIFMVLSEREHCFFLDSSLSSNTLGKYSFMGAAPTEIITCTPETEHPFQVLRQAMTRMEIQRAGHRAEDLPFVGGLVGYFSYDLGRKIEVLPEKSIEDVKVPYFWFGRYDRVIGFDHEKQELWLILNGETEQELDAGESELLEVLRLAKDRDPELIRSNGASRNVEASVTNPPERIERPALEDLEIKAVGSTEKDGMGKSATHIYRENSAGERSSAMEAERMGLRPNMTKEAYLESVQRIRDYIRTGDVYQVNMTQRFSMDVEREAREIYLELRERNAAPFAAFLDFSDASGTRHILSSSPERLVKYENEWAESRPIKGTLPRGKTPAEDQRLAETLENSEKDRSELLMIVDLVRNDLGKVARPGTVKVPQLFHVEHYATVHHLVASVVCQLEEEKDQMHLMESIFPGGSITGAPKIRAMEIIDELEPTRRNIYTGSLGYISYDGNMDMNILIRSILKVKEKAYYQVGGGIVWDSDPSAEYDETLHKGKAILKTLTGF